MFACFFSCHVAAVKRIYCDFKVVVGTVCHFDLKVYFFQENWKNLVSIG